MEQRQRSYQDGRAKLGVVGQHVNILNYNNLQNILYNTILRLRSIQVESSGMVWKMKLI